MFRWWIFKAACREAPAVAHGEIDIDRVNPLALAANSPKRRHYATAKTTDSDAAALPDFGECAGSKSGR